MNQPAAPARIGVLGSGPIGSGLATLLAGAGHDVVQSSRTPADGHVAGAIATVSLAEAAGHGEVVFVAVAHEAVRSVLDPLRLELSGKVVVDVTNPFALQGGRIVSSHPGGLSQGMWLAALLPEARIVRAFSHIQDELLVSRARRQPGLWAVAVAGDDSAAVQAVEGLVRGVGYEPVCVGGLADSAVLDPGGALFPHMFTPADMRAVLGHPSVEAGSLR